MKTLKLPQPPDDKHWQLKPRHKFFLDLTITTGEYASALYAMVFMSTESPAKMSQKANALMSSSDGKEYLEQRKMQLRKWYFPDEFTEEELGIEVEPVVEKSIDEQLADMIPNVMKDLQGILSDQNNANYQDAFKTIMTKMMKDIQMNKTSEPPRRYLPEICDSPCRYKAFCEKECVDECEICNYKKYANENGIFFDYKTQLSRKEKQDGE